jgi:hypothetical protein
MRHIPYGSEPPDPPELAEFKDVHQDDDGVWHAVHESGYPISAPTWPEMVTQGVVVRVLTTWHQTWGTGRPDSS